MDVAAVLTTAIGLLLLLGDAADAWKWGKLFSGGGVGDDSVVTVAADGRGVYPAVVRAYSGYKTVLLRVPVLSEFGPPAVVTRVRHIYGLSPAPPAPSARLPPPPPPVYGVPAPAGGNAATTTTAAAVAAAVARTILEAHGFSRSFEGAGRQDHHHHLHLSAPGRTALWAGPKSALLPPPTAAGEDQSDHGLYWREGGGAAAVPWRRRR